MPFFSTKKYEFNAGIISAIVFSAIAIGIAIVLGRLTWGSMGCDG